MMHWLSGYNYDFGLASIPIQLVLIAFYFSRKNLPVRQTFSFAIVMISNLVMTIADIVSCEMNEVWMQYPLWGMYLVNMVYFAGFLIRGWSLFDFTAEICRAYRIFANSFKVFNMIPCLFMIGAVISTPWTHAIFYFTENGYVNSGIYDAIYYHTFFYIVASIVVVLFTFKYTGVRLKLSLLGYNLILIAGILLRKMFFHTLVTSYFSILAILVIYLFSQNPDLYWDKKIGVFNQIAFEEIVSDCLYKKARFHLIIASIDNYEVAKSVYGYQQVIESLQVIGNWMQAQFQRYYVFCFGNGHFVLFRKKKYDMSKDQVIEKITARFEHPWKSTDMEVSFAENTYVLPYDVMPSDTYSVTELVEYLINKVANADSAPFSLVSETTVQQMKRRKLVEAAVAAALKENRLETYYQPIYSVKERKIAGAEALARLNDPVLGFVPPDEFIEAAEQNGMIMELGRQVFENACRFIEKAKLKEKGIQFINVNLSPAQCMNENLAEEFIEIANRYGVPMNTFDFEITESAAADLTKIREQMEKLEAAGAYFSLDDFGTGTSNLTRLLSLPLHVIKFDMTVVWAYFKKELEIFPDLVKMFCNADMKIVVEGVETEEMSSELAEMGCHYEQGYYFSKPVTEEEFLKLL